MRRVFERLDQADGEVSCSSLEAELPFDPAGRPWFAQLKSEKAFTVGQYAVGREGTPIRPNQAWAELTDIHYTVPARVLAMAQALDILPDRVLIVGCQGSAVDELHLGLSAPVRAAVAGAVDTIEALVAQLDAKPGPASWSGTDVRPA